MKNNLFSYLKQYGSIDFNQEPINEIDILIFSRLSYVNFELFLNQSTISIVKAVSTIKQQKIKKQDFYWPNDYSLMTQLAKTNRFKDLKIKNFKYLIDNKIEKQFAAITIDLPNNYRIISYRGTADELVGWKEDFNMSFMDKIPAQVEAKRYLRKIFFKKPFKKLILVGHSKGGNLAIYAAMNTSFLTKQAIERVYNIDGPGFKQQIIESEAYLSIKDKIVTFLPQGSIVGKMLNCGDYQVVKSSGFSLLQHDVYQWWVKDKNLVRLDKTSSRSDQTDQILTKWLESLTEQERRQFIDILYQLISASKAKTVSQLLTNAPQKISLILKAYKTTDPKQKQFLNQVKNQLLEIIKQSVFEQNKK